MKKKLLFGVGGILTLLLALAALLPLLFDANSFRPQIQSALETGLKRKVELGSLGLKMFPLSVSVSNVKVAEANGWDAGPPFLVADEVLVKIDLRALLNKQVKIDSLAVIHPTIRLSSNADGKWNFQSLGQQSEGSGESNLSISELTVKDATLILSRAGSVPQSLTAVNVTLHDFKPGKPAKVEASGHLPGEGKQLVDVSGTLDKGFDGKFQLTDVSQAGLKGIGATGTVRAPAGGAIQFSTNLTAVEPAFSGAIEGNITPGEQMKASLQGKNLQMNRKEWKHPVRISTLIMTLDQDTASFQPFVVESGDFKANANLKVTEVAKAPTIEAEIDSSGTIAQMLATASAFGMNVSGINANGKIALQATLKGSAAQPAALSYRASGTLNETEIVVAGLDKPVQLRHASFHATPKLIQFEVDTPELSLIPTAQAQSGGSGKQSSKSSTAIRQALQGSARIGKLITSSLTFDNVVTQFSLNHGTLKMDPLQGNLYGGGITASIESDLRQDPVAVKVSTKINAIDAVKFLGSTTGLKQILAGKLSADGGFQFNLNSNEPLAKSLSGNFKFELLDGRLNGLNLMNEFARIGRFLGFAMKDTSFTDFLKLAATMKIENGLATSDNIRLEFGGGSLGAAGTLNLLDEKMNMKLMTTLDRDISKSAGGTQIGGFLSTALANEKGELILPLLATGLLSKPHLVPDGERIAKMKLQSATGAIKSVKDIQNAAESVRGIFDQFRKKKEQ